jgi:hypothetical protein
MPRCGRRCSCAVAAIVNVATIANTAEDCNDQLRDCNPNPPSAKPTSAMAVENAAIRRSYSKSPYVKPLVAQPGQTTNDSRVSANEKEETRSRRAQNKKEPTALRHLPHSKRAKAQHVQRERGAAYVVKQLVSQKSQVTRVNRLQPLTRNPRTDRHGAFDAKERTQLDPVTAIRPRFATSKTRGCYLMRAPAIARHGHLPADRGERGARRRDRASTWHCLGALGVLSETREEI